MSIDAKWWKIDFHVHTPASHDYKEPGVTARAWLMAAMDQALDAVVVADHNSGGWIGELQNAYEEMSREKPDGFREMVIFPGFELSVAGEPGRYHLLCILDPAKGHDHLTACLGECGIRDGFGNEEKVSTLRGLEDIIHAVQNHGGILIPAHINNDKGLIGTRTTLTPDLEKALSFFIAAEFCSQPKYVDGHMKAAIRRMAVLGGSDAHVTRRNVVGCDGAHHHWIGENTSWVKMGEPTVESLKMALCDPDDCVRSDGPAPKADFLIKNVRIENLVGSASTPYCDQLSLGFASAMTAVIGGRGSGKSTIARCVREVFDRAPDVPESSDIANQWETYKKSSKLAKIVVSFDLHGSQYRLTVDSGVERLEEYVNDCWHEAELGMVRHRFPISVFGQKEVGELANRPNGLLSFVDEAGATQENWCELWEKHSSGYLGLRIRERELEHRISSMASLKIETEDLNRNIADYEKKGGSDVLKSYQTFSQQRSALSVSPSIIGEEGLIQQVNGLVSGFKVPKFPSELFASSDSYRMEMQSIYKGFTDKLLLIQKKLASLGVEIANVVSEYEAARDSTEWMRSCEASREAYVSLCHDSRDGLNIGDYEKWVARRNVLAAQLRDLETEKERLSKVRSDAQEEKRQLLALRDSLKKKRQAFVNNTLQTNRLLRMKIRKFANLSGLENRLRATLGVGDEWQKPVIDKLLEPVMSWCSDRQGSDELLQLLENVKKTLHEVRLGTKDLGMRFNRKVKECWDTNPSAFDEFDIWWPEDSISVEYSMNNGQSYKPMDAGASAGQKATVMLAFLLSYGTNPIIIDQPEDDIDNRLITELLVQQLRDNKNRRQVIVMTHNPNVVVNGGAESVAVMSFQDGRVVCAGQGPIDCAMIKTDICDIMEGGKEAFRKRYHRELGGVK